MSNAKTNAKKTTKNVRNVLVQPYDVKWPLIEGDDSEEFIRYLQQIERKHIVTGCNPVIRLLQNGQAAAFFIQNTFHPKVFAKIIIRMARKRNPSILTLALPTLPEQGKTSGMMMAVTLPIEGDEHSSAIKQLLKWMTNISVEKKFITAKRDKLAVRKRAMTKHRKQRDRPMTDEEVAKLYVLEPISEHGATHKHLNVSDPASTADFISFSDTTSRVTIKSNSSNARQPIRQLVDRKAFKKSYVPLTVNKVQGNPNRVEHKKKKRT